MALRTCKKCEIEKDLHSSFSTRKTPANILYRWECVSCINIRASELRKQKSCKFTDCMNIVTSSNLCSTHKNQLDPRIKEYRKKYLTSKKGKKNNQFWQKMRRKKDRLKLANIFKNEIKQVYLSRPENMAIDHIIPLVNENVSGLHVPWNLQYLTKSENSKKRNKFDFTFDNDSWQLNYQENKQLPKTE